MFYFEVIWTVLCQISLAWCWNFMDLSSFCQPRPLNGAILVILLQWKELVFEFVNCLLMCLALVLLIYPFISWVWRPYHGLNSSWRLYLFEPSSLTRRLGSERPRTNCQTKMAIWVVKDRACYHSWQRFHLCSSCWYRYRRVHGQVLMAWFGCFENEYFIE